MQAYFKVCRHSGILRLEIKDMYSILTETYSDGKLVGRGLSTKQYVYKGTAMRIAKEAERDFPGKNVKVCTRVVDTMNYQRISI